MNKSTTPVNSTSATEEPHPLDRRVTEIINAAMGDQGIDTEQIADICELADISAGDLARKLSGEEPLHMGDIYNISIVLDVQPSELVEVAVRIHERRGGQ